MFISKYIENSFYNVCWCTLHTHMRPYCTHNTINNVHYLDMSVHWHRRYQCHATGAEVWGYQGGHCPPPKFCLPPQCPPKFSAWRHATGVGLFLKVLHRPLTAPLLQNWPLQWPPKMKMSGSAPAMRYTHSCCSWLHRLELVNSSRQAQVTDGNSGHQVTGKQPAAIELPRRVHSTTTRLHYYYIGISELW